MVGVVVFKRGLMSNAMNGDLINTCDSALNISHQKYFKGNIVIKKVYHLHV